jgi:hypothetical protein
MVVIFVNSINLKVLRSMDFTKLLYCGSSSGSRTRAAHVASLVLDKKKPVELPDKR